VTISIKAKAKFLRLKAELIRVFGAGESGYEVLDAETVITRHTKNNLPHDRSHDSKNR